MLEVSQTLWFDAFPARMSSGRCSEAIGGDLGSAPGHAGGWNGALHTAAGGLRWVPLSSPLVGWERSAPSSASAGSSECCCVPLPHSGNQKYPKCPCFSPVWGLRSADASAQQICLGVGEGEPALPNARGSGLALAQLGWGFLLLLGCGAKCWAGSTTVQPDRSSEAVNAAMGALAFICKANVSWFGDPSLTPSLCNSLWDLNATRLLLHRVTAVRENAPARAQHPHVRGCGVELRAKLIPADGGVNAFEGEQQGRAGVGCASPPPPGISARVSSRRDALAGNPATRA